MELNRTYDAATVNSIMRQMQGIPDGGESTVEGETPMTLTRAMAAPLVSLKRRGLCVQDGTPEPDALVNILCNNGVLTALNILNLNDIYGNYLLTDNGEVGSAAPDWYLTNFIRVLPNTAYTFSFISGADLQYRRICGYSAADESSFTERLMRKARPTTVGVQYDISFTTGSNTNYIRVSARVDDTNTQFCAGAVVPPFHPFGEVFALGAAEDLVLSNAHAADQHFTVADLLAVAGYATVQELIAGIKTGKVAAYALNGYEPWTKSGNVFASSSALPQKARGKSMMLCTHFVYSAGSTSEISNGQFGSASTSTNTYFRHSAITTVEGWIDFLKSEHAAGHPVIAVYLTAESVTERLTPQPATSSGGILIITASTAIGPNVPVEVKYNTY